MPKIAIIGTTSWGITLGVVLTQGGLEVRLWARTEQEATELKNTGPNPILLPGITFPPKLSITSSLSKALAEVKAVILAVPSQTMRQNIKLVAGYLPAGQVLMDKVSRSPLLNSCFS